MIGKIKIFLLQIFVNVNNISDCGKFLKHLPTLYSFTGGFHFSLFSSCKYPTGLNKRPRVVAICCVIKVCNAVLTVINSSSWKITKEQFFLTCCSRSYFNRQLAFSLLTFHKAEQLNIKCNYLMENVCVTFAAFVYTKWLY